MSGLAGRCLTDRTHIDGWRQVNPEWEVIGWNESNIDLSHPLIAEAYRNRKRAKVADIVRLMAVHDQGGVYLDTDIEVLRPLDSLLQHRCFFCFQGSTKESDLVANGCFGAERGHWFIKEALQTLLAMRTIPFGLDRPTRYGPKLITRLLRGHGLERTVPEGVQLKDIFVCPSPVFFPYPYDGTFTPDCIKDNTLAIHYWDQSWDSTVPLPMRIARSVKQRIERAMASGHA